MKRTISWTALAWKSVITLTLTAFGFFTASTVAQGTGSESAGSEPCNLAIVSKTRVKGRTCDVKTIRELARDGHVYEQNQLGIASIRR